MTWKLEWDRTLVCVGLAGFTLLAARRAVKYYTTRCPSQARMVGKTVIVTGANCGIGYETALELARRGARVIMACRDLEKATQAATQIKRQTGNEDVVVSHLDLVSLTSVRQFYKKIEQTEEKVDVLVNNAGVMNAPFSLTEDGLEYNMAVNHFGNFLLSNLLLERLSKSPCGRIVFVSSSLHRYGTVNLDDINSRERHTAGRPYSDSKLMNLLFARELHRRKSNNGKLCINSLHPGMVRTLIGRRTLFYNKYFRIFAFPLFAVMYVLATLLVKSAREGCQTVVYCCVAPELDGESDGYYGNCKKELWSGPASDLDLAAKVWDVSAKLTKLEV